MNQSALQPQPEWILFDVYDTLLDMGEIKRRINGALSTRKGYQIWFGLLTQYCFLHNCVGQYQDFTSVCRATLKMAGVQLGVSVSEGHIEDLLLLMRHLPLHEGIPPRLSHLYDAGYKLAALTNAPKDVVADRMERTGLVSYFGHVLSSETIRQYKPSCTVYEWAARQLDTTPAQCLMVSTHDWDLTGAHYAGMKTAYLERPHQLRYPLSPAPDYISKNFAALVEQLA